MIDRCFYRGDPSNVAVNWLDSDGNKLYRSGAGREPPEVTSRPVGSRTIYLADYGCDVEPADTVRRHPADEAPTESLFDALDRHDIAIGHSSTALVKAALMGLKTMVRDKNHILNQKNWLNLLPYSDWHKSEIESGKTWEFLSQWA